MTAVAAAAAAAAAVVVVVVVAVRCVARVLFAQYFAACV